MTSFTSNNLSETLAWNRNDIEQFFGFHGGKFTRVNSLFSFIVAALIASIVFTILIFGVRTSSFGKMFLERGFTPYAMVLLFAWSLVIIFIKWQKLRFQRRALSIEVIPSNLEFVISVSTVDQVLSNIVKSTDDPRNFVLFNRAFTALSNLRNLGQISDVDEMLRSQAELDESSVETSYSLLRGFIWAIPVLGFIGTVMGLSIAIGGFGDVLSNTSDPAELATSLKGVTGGLSTAFETTLIALVFALILQLLVTFLHKSEEEFLDACSEYCQRKIVGKLRLMPFE